LAALFVCVVLGPNYAEAKLTRVGKATVHFTALGSMGLKMVGSTSDLGIVEEAQSISIVVHLANLDTGISLRDRHMRDKYLQVQQFPTTTLVVPRSSLTLPADGTTGKGKLQGTLRLHGQEHPVSVQYEARRHGKSLEVEGSAHIKMTDFGIIVPAYLGITVKPDVDLVAKFVANEL
jgi:polyisoprenoid-binding protein YceI